MKRKMIVSVFAAAFLACVCALGGCSGKKAVDLSEYVSVEFSGYNGNGTANVVIDTDAMMPLLDEQNFPEMIADNFSAAEIKNNGSLSNGDSISVTVKFSEKMIENANLDVQNPTLTFTVSGLKEKEKLDVFKGVEFTSEGTSPECTVSVEYNGGSPYEMLEMQLENGEIVKSDFGNRHFKNGEKITLKISENALEKLRTEYIVEETSREYTVETNSHYVLLPDDMTENEKEDFYKAAEKFLNDKIQEVIDGKDNDARYKLFSQMTDINIGTFYAGITTRIDKLEVKEFNSAYVGIGDVSGSWGSVKENQKSIYYIFDAEITYYVKHFFDVYEGTSPCTLIVRMDDPRITPQGAVYSGMTFTSEKDLNSAYNSYITSKFEKIS